jgi:hypothetical protein
MVIGDLMALLLGAFPSGGPRSDFIKFIVERGGISLDKAEILIDRWRADGIVYQDPEGYLKWLIGERPEKPMRSPRDNEASTRPPRPKALCDACFSRHRGAKVISRPLLGYVCEECGDKASIMAEVLEE